MGKPAQISRRSDGTVLVVITERAAYFEYGQLLLISLSVLPGIEQHLTVAGSTKDTSEVLLPASLASDLSVLSVWYSTLCMHSAIQ